MLLKLKKMLGTLPCKEKFEMAKSSSTLRAAWLKLAKDKDALIRIALAHQKEIDAEILDVLVEDPSPMCRI